MTNPMRTSLVTIPNKSLVLNFPVPCRIKQKNKYKPAMTVEPEIADDPTALILPQLVMTEES